MYTVSEDERDLEPNLTLKACNIYARLSFFRMPTAPTNDSISLEDRAASKLQATRLQVSSCVLPTVLHTISHYNRLDILMARY